MTERSETLIGVDWGASNLRAFRFDLAGNVVERRSSPEGMKTLKAADFEPILSRLCEGWTSAAGVRFLLCGMVGSRQGWAEAPYLSCPAGFDDLARALVPLSTDLGPARIVPGISLASSDAADVMRGEETQIVGAVADDWTGVVVAPGTHSKWAWIEAGRIIRFRTFMTGELYAVLKSHSILGQLMQDGGHDAAAFETGVIRALRDGAVTALLFSVRAEALLGRIASAALPSYLSGLLIGSEIAAGSREIDACAPVMIIASDAVVGLYAHALRLAGHARLSTVDGETAAARGLWRLDRTVSSV
jgi:2-dehydro-3-deoxygalactonokinase